MEKSKKRTRRVKVSPHNSVLITQALTLLTGKPYTNAAQTDIRQTFKAFGWVPPTEARQTCAEK